MPNPTYPGAGARWRARHPNQSPPTPAPPPAPAHGPPVPTPAPSRTPAPVYPGAGARYRATHPGVLPAGPQQLPFAAAPQPGETPPPEQLPAVPAPPTGNPPTWTEQVYGWAKGVNFGQANAPALRLPHPEIAPVTPGATLADVSDLTIGPLLGRLAQIPQNINKPVTEAEAADVAARRASPVPYLPDMHLAVPSPAPPKPAPIVGSEAPLDVKLKRAAGELALAPLSALGEAFYQVPARAIGTAMNLTEWRGPKNTLNTPAGPIEIHAIGLPGQAEPSTDPNAGLYVQPSTLAEVGQALMSGRETFERDVNPLVQAGLAFALDPLMLYSGNEVRFARELPRAFEKAVVQTDLAAPEVLKLIQSGRAFEVSPVTRALEKIPVLGPKLQEVFPRLPTTNAALLAEDAVSHLGSVLSVAKDPVETQELLTMFGKKLRGDATWLETAEKYKIAPRTLDAAEAARLGKPAGTVLSPVTSRAGVETQLVLEKMIPHPAAQKRLGKMLDTINAGFVPGAQKAARVASDQAAADLLKAFVAASNEVVGVSKEKNLGDAILRGWSEYQGATASVQLASLGRTSRDFTTSVTQGLMDDVFGNLPRNFFRDTWRGVPLAGKRGVGAGFEQGGKVAAGLQARGGVAGWVGKGLGGMARLAGAKEDFFAQLAWKKGADYAKDILWHAGTVLPPEEAQALKTALGPELYQKFIDGATGVWHPLDVEAAAKNILGNESWRNLPEDWMRKLRHYGLDTEAQRIANEAADGPAFRKAMIDLELSRRSGVAGAKPILPPSDVFENAMREELMARGVTGSALEDAVKVGSAQRDGRRGGEVVAQSLARDTIENLPQASKSEWVKKWEQLRQDLGREGQTVAGKARAIVVDAKVNNFDPEEEVSALWKKYFDDAEERWHALREAADQVPGAEPGLPSDVAREMSASAHSPARVPTPKPQTVNDLAHEYGVPTATAQGKPNNKQLLNLINKHGPTQYGKLSDVPLDEARNALENWKVATTGGAIAEAPAVAPEVISTTPRHELPKDVSEAVGATATQMLTDLRSGAAGERIPVGYGADRATVVQPTTLPPWYREFYDRYAAKNETVQKALQKIIDDAGKDVDKGAGRTIKRLKDAILKILTEGDPVSGTPPEPEILRALGRSEEEIAAASAAWEKAGVKPLIEARAAPTPPTEADFFPPPEAVGRAMPGEPVVNVTPEGVATPTEPITPRGSYKAPPPGKLDPVIAAKVGLPHEVRDLRKFRDEMLVGWGAKYENVTPEGAQALKSATATVKARLAELRAVQDRFGTVIRDTTYFNYNDRRNFDTLFGALYAYPYWYTREAASTLRRAFTNPHALWALQNAHEQTAKINADMPPWMKYAYNQTVGEGGLLSFNLFANVDPTESFWRPDFHDPVISADPGGRVYQTLNDFGPGSAHAGIPEILGLLAAWQGKDDLAYAYASRISTLTNLIQGAVPGLAPERLLGSFSKGYAMMSTDTPTGTVFVGTKYDRKRLDTIIANMVAQGKVSQELAYQVKFITGHPLDKRYVNDPAYAQAWDVFRQALDQKNHETWAVDMHGVTVPSPTLSSWLFGQAFRYRTEEEVKIMQAQQAYSDLLQKVEQLPQTQDGTDEQQRLMNEFWNDPKNESYAFTAFSGKKDQQLDKAYAWNVLSRIGPGRINDAYLTQAGMDSTLLNEFYKTRGKDMPWLDNTYQYRQFMDSISMLGASLALPDLATQKEWDAAKTARKDLYAQFNREYTPQQQALFDQYKSGQVTQPKEWLKAHPDIAEMLNRESQLVMQNPLVAAYYASDKILANYAYQQFNAEHAEAQRLNEIDNTLQDAGDAGDAAAADAENAFYKKNKLVLQAYRVALKAFSAEGGGLDTAVVALRDTLPAADLPVLRKDIATFTGVVGEVPPAPEAGGTTTGGATPYTTEAVPSAAGARYVATQGEPLATPNLLPTPGEPTTPQAIAESLILAAREKALKSKEYLTTDAKDAYGERWIRPHIDAYGVQDAEDALANPVAAPDGTPMKDWVSPTTADSVLNMIADSSAKSLREGLLNYAGANDDLYWTRVLSWARSLKPAEISGLVKDNPQLSDLPLVASQASKYKYPSLDALDDVLGIKVNVSEDGTYSISKQAGKPAKAAKVDWWLAGSLGTSPMVTPSAVVAPSANVPPANALPAAIAPSAPVVPTVAPQGNAAPNPYATTPQGTVTGVMKWADMAAQQGQAAGGVPAEFILALIKAESNGNPNAVGDGGHSVGLFQLHDHGVGTGYTVEQRQDPALQFQLMMPRISAAYQSGVARGLTGRELAMWVGQQAERPAAAAVPRYGVAYDQIVSGGLPAPGSVGVPAPSAPPGEPVEPAAVAPAVAVPLTSNRPQPSQGIVSLATSGDVVARLFAQAEANGITPTFENSAQFQRFLDFAGEQQFPGAQALSDQYRALTITHGKAIATDFWNGNPVLAQYDTWRNDLEKRYTAGGKAPSSALTSTEVDDYIHSLAEQQWPGVTQTWNEYVQTVVFTGNEAGAAFWQAHPELDAYDKFRDEIKKRFAAANKGEVSADGGGGKGHKPSKSEQADAEAAASAAVWIDYQNRIRAQNPRLLVMLMDYFDADAVGRDQMLRNNPNLALLLSQMDASTLAALEKGYYTWGAQTGRFVGVPGAEVKGSQAGVSPQILRVYQKRPAKAGLPG